MQASSSSRAVGQPPAIVTLLCFVFVLLVVEMEKEVVLPALPDVLKTLNISYGLTQAILYINFVGFCCSCLIAGPLTMRFGYKRLIQSMSLVFMLGSLTTCVTTSISCIIVGRFLQGAAGSLLFIALLALVARLYQGQAATRLLGYVNGLTCFMTAAGPLIGAFLVNAYGWEASFIAIGVLSLLSYMATALGFYSGHAAFKKVVSEASQRRRLADEKQAYLRLLTDPAFLRFGVVPAFMCAAYMVLLSFLPFFLIDHLGLSRLYYGVYQTGVLLAFSIPCFFAGPISECLGAARAERWGVIISSLLGLFYGGALWFGYENPVVLGVIALAMFAAQAVPYSNYMSYGIAAAPGEEALGSALGLFLRLGFSAVGIWASSALGSAIIANVGTVIAVVSLGGLIVYLLPVPERTAHASDTGLAPSEGLVER